MVFPACRIPRVIHVWVYAVAVKEFSFILADLALQAAIERIVSDASSVVARLNGKYQGP